MKSKPEIERTLEILEHSRDEIFRLSENVEGMDNKENQFIILIMNEKIELLEWVLSNGD